MFTTLTQAYNPMYFNVEFARAHEHPGVVVNPMLVFGIVFGLSVEDLSEAGGPFLGVDELAFHAPVYPGDTLTARSTVVPGGVAEPSRTRDRHVAHRRVQPVGCARRRLHAVEPDPVR